MRVLRAGKAERFLAAVALHVNCLGRTILHSSCAVAPWAPLGGLGQIHEGLDQELVVSIAQRWLEQLLEQALGHDHVAATLGASREGTFDTVANLAR